MTLPIFPVHETLPMLDKAMGEQGCAVLVAPPGAGKTTIIPLHMLASAYLGGGKIILLEPRRLAARAAARRMASLLGEKVGETVGYQMRFDTAISDKTRILVVTEGIYTRMVLDDPELKGVSAVLFDEFHERSLDADFGLALTLDIREALRPDLKLIVMSATLDGARIAKLLDAPIIKSEGRAFPVQIRYQSSKPNERLEQTVTSTVLDMLYDETGSILVFLPGVGEIERTLQVLQEKTLPSDVNILPLYGALSAKEQDEAISPPKNGKRKVVLATSIAETSLTIDGVRIVIDSGLARIPVFEPAIGLTRLETQKASRAAIDQRAGRAGRTEPGLAIRLWHEGQTSSLPAFNAPEVLSADLSGFVLDCTAFGVTDPTSLSFLDAPPKPALQEATTLLKKLNALDSQNQLTQTGKMMRHLSLPVRYAHMVVEAAKRGEAQKAADIAVLLSERGLGGSNVDLDVRFATFQRENSERAKQAKLFAKRLAQQVNKQISKDFKIRESENALLLISHFLIFAWPDRVAKARGQRGHFLLANGRGAVLSEEQSLAKAPFLVVAELTGSATQSRILSAAEIDEETIRDLLKQDVQNRTEMSFDLSTQQLKAKAIENIGAITLSSRPLPTPKGEEAALATLDAVRHHGLNILPWKGEAENLRQRLDFLYQTLGEVWPNVSDDALLLELENWLYPFLSDGLKTFSSSQLAKALMSLVPYNEQREIDKIVPKHFVVPTGSDIAIRYEQNAAFLSVRVQELFGLKEHPTIAKGRIPLVLELLSPGQRPIQVTRDLVGFWQGSWADVAKDMRGRYPKHIWPDNPMEAQATRRAKPRIR